MDLHYPIIKRSVLEELRRDIQRKEIAFLIGPRQAGKTTIMQIIEKELAADGQKTLFLSLDYEADRIHFGSQERLLKKIELELGQGPGSVFIDEIQRLENAGIFLKGLQDKGLPWKLFASGSGSVDLKAKIKESMVGRKRTYEVYPLSLNEFVHFKTGYRYKNRFSDFPDIEKSRSDNLLLEYLSFGGYPRVVLEIEQRDKQRVMDEIYESYIMRDIAYLLKVEKLDAFGQLVRTLAGQAGKILNYSDLASTLAIAAATVKNYLWYAEGTYILNRITPFFRNIRSEISKAPSVYFTDIGFRNFACGVFGRVQQPAELGFTFQNLVYLVLREKLRWSGGQIHFYRTTSKTEIDFIVDTGKSLIPIEVKYRRLPRALPPRSFDGFISKYAPEYGIVINLDLQATIRIRNTEVHFITIWDLLHQDWV